MMDIVFMQLDVITCYVKCKMIELYLAFQTKDAAVGAVYVESS